MKSKYSIFIMENEKVSKDELSNLVKNSYYWAALPEKYYEEVTGKVDEIQDKAAAKGEL